MVRVHTPSAVLRERGGRLHIIPVFFRPLSFFKHSNCFLQQKNRTNNDNDIQLLQCQLQQHNDHHQDNCIMTNNILIGSHLYPNYTTGYRLTLTADLCSMELNVTPENLCLTDDLFWSNKLTKVPNISSYEEQD